MEKIKFMWNGSFVGTTYFILVNGKQYGLGDFGEHIETYKQNAVKLLKEKFDIDYDINDIEFEWGGEL